MRFSPTSNTTRPHSKPGSRPRHRSVWVFASPRAKRGSCWRETGSRSRSRAFSTSTGSTSRSSTDSRTVPFTAPSSRPTCTHLTGAMEARVRYTLDLIADSAPLAAGRRSKAASRRLRSPTRRGWRVDDRTAWDTITRHVVRVAETLVARQGGRWQERSTSTSSPNPIARSKTPTKRSTFFTQRLLPAGSAAPRCLAGDRRRRGPRAASRTYPGLFRLLPFRGRVPGCGRRDRASAVRLGFVSAECN